MKIYTKTGDKGETSLFGGDRVKKNNQRIIAFGTLDELNSSIGIIRSYSDEVAINQDLIIIQQRIFRLGAEFATPNNKINLNNGNSRLSNLIEKEDISFLENKIDLMEQTLDPLKFFILPGGNNLAEAFSQLARTICRRTEREVIVLNEDEKVREIVLQFLNRLSDYLFVLGRYFLKQNNEKPIEWK
ncbi:MAG: cob(I)yrinic acid a,c-diamide adenosyltransferase [Solirubrobacteraceae bacterium]